MDHPVIDTASITCTTIDGGTTVVPRSSLPFRPSVYAIIVHEGRVLVMREVFRVR